MLAESFEPFFNLRVFSQNLFITCDEHRKVRDMNHFTLNKCFKTCNASISKSFETIFRWVYIYNPANVSVKQKWHSLFQLELICVIRYELFTIISQDLTHKQNIAFDILMAPSHFCYPQLLSFSCSPFLRHGSV